MAYIFTADKVESMLIFAKIRQCTESLQFEQYAFHFPAIKFIVLHRAITEWEKMKKASIEPPADLVKSMKNMCWRVGKKDLCGLLGIA